MTVASNCNPKQFGVAVYKIKNRPEKRQRGPKSPKPLTGNFDVDPRMGPSRNDL